MDERIRVLAKNLVNHSMKVKQGEKVYVHYIGSSTTDLAKALIEEVYNAGLSSPPSMNESAEAV